MEHVPEEPFRHVTVAFEPGRFKGWPANHGLWAWGDEMLVMYDDAVSDTSDVNRHTFDANRPVPTEQARSRDGGWTWKIEKSPWVRPGPPGRLWNGGGGPLPADLPAPLDFSHPDLALCFQMAHHEYGTSYFYASTDRGRVWRGPFLLPTWGYATVNARTDYLVNGPHDCFLFLSGNQCPDANEDGTEVFHVRTRDGGLTWDFVARANRPTPPTGTDRPNMTIMPSSVRLDETELLCLARCGDRAANKFWIEAWASGDDGAAWAFRSRVDTGNSSTPPALTWLPGDGRLVLTYGYRAAPFGVRARVSRDNGATWGREIVLRDDGGNFDLGYTRNALRPDGKLVTVYYFNDDPRKERRIEATIWDPANHG